MELLFGTETVKRSFHHGKVLNRKVTYSIPTIIEGKDKQDKKAKCLSEVMKALDLISSKKTSVIELRIEAHSKKSKTPYEFRLVTKSYMLDE